MSYTLKFAAAACAAILATGAAAEIRVTDAYLRSTSPDAPSGAAFMMIENTGDAADRLIAVRSDVAARIELHTHIADDAGVMRMTEIEGGIAVPAEGMAMLKRGGDHVMFMGLNRPLEQGDAVDVIFVFEEAGEIAATIPVDRERMPAGHGHGSD
jgi:copper(I)-binding protein